MSGREAFAIARRLFRTPAGRELPDALVRGLFVGWVHDPRTAERVDEVVLLVFPGPHSFTTEDVVELQGHAGPAVLARVLGLVLSQGARLAAAGEFSKRAFLGGRLDLTRAEAIADVASARTERALALALGQLEGGLARATQALRDPAQHLWAELEASLDFPDEIDPPSPERLEATLQDLLARADALLATAEGGRLLREGATLAIVGRPNVGKSSLLNALLRADRALVSEVAGTTRDVIESELAIGGVPFRVLDTAGIRTHTADRVERMGIDRSRDVLERADMRLVVVEAGRSLDAEDREILAAAEAAGPTVVAVNKADRADSGGSPVLPEPVRSVRVSARTGAGLADLEQAIYDDAIGQALAPVAAVALNARHRAALQSARDSLDRARLGVGQDLPADFVASDLKEAVEALGTLTGEALREAVIDHIFEHFCVGK